LENHVSTEAKSRALAIIRDEHRSLAAVLHGMLFLTRAVEKRGTAPNFPVLRAMVYYIDSFSERFHHPKEDTYLYAALRRRSSAANKELQEIEQQHAEGAKLIRDLEQSLLRYEEGGVGEFPQFAKIVDEYAAFHWNHMHLEEDTVMPLAERYLTDADWQRIAAAFAENGDPLFNVERDQEFRALFSKIVTLAPAPLGVGSPLS
jgi:hemerythrin-like domain-containing protein